MSAILVISVLLRAVAVIWTLAVLRRLRNPRILFLTAMLVLMTARQFLTLAGELSTGSPVVLDLTANLEELPGLMVSLMAFLLILNLEGLATNSGRFVSTPTKPSRVGVSMLPALVIGLASILGTVAVAHFAYENSRNSIRQTVADQNLALGQTIGDFTLRSIAPSSGRERAGTIDRIRDAWAKVHSPFASSYLCVIGPAGTLDLHTMKPEMKGTDVSQVVVCNKTGETTMQLLHAKRDWSGQNENFGGSQQIVGYHYEPSIDSFIAVHVPVAAVDARFQAAVAPWVGGMALIGGLLLPCSLGLLYHNSWQANQLALSNLSALRESEERHRQLVEHSPFCIHEIEADGRFSSMNAAGLKMMGTAASADVCGLDYLSAVGDADRARIGELLANANRGQISHFEFESLQGQSFLSCFVPLLNSEGAVQRIMGITQDVTERRKSEAKQQESEALFRTIFEQAAVGVAQLNSVSGQVLWTNDRYCTILNATSAQLVGKTWMEITHPNDLTTDLVNMERLRAGEIREFSIEKRLERNDGTFVWIQLTVSPMWQPGEAPTTHIAVVEDITARKDAEESLRLSEERYRSLVTATTATVWVTDAQGGFTEAQPMWEAFTGQPWEEHQGYGWSKMLHPNDMDRMVETWRNAIQNGQPYFNVGRIFHAGTGEYRYCEAHASPIKNSDGAVREWFGTTVDVHDRRITEIELLAQHALTERILETMLDGYILADGTGQLLDVNPAYCELVGYEADELRSMNIQELEAALPQEEIEERIARIVLVGRMRFETAHRHRDGRQIDLDVSITALPPEMGEAPSIAAFVRDISERKQAETALRQSEESLRELNATLERRVMERTAELAETNAELTAFAHSVSHDLRAPLRAMEGFAAALAEDYGVQLEHAGREYVQHIVDSAKRMDTLVNDLLAYSRLGRSEVRMQEVGLEKIVTDALGQLAADIEDCGAKVEFTKGMPTVLGHKSTLVQIVTNLLSNGMKFVAPTEQPRLKVWTQRDDDGKLRLWVEDNGIGIDPDYQDRIFRVFERLHGIESYPGTGIGLAIVARACERLGCRCGVESQLGQGSRFWVEFPESETNK